MSYYINYNNKGVRVTPLNTANEKTTGLQLETVNGYRTFLNVTNNNNTLSFTETGPNSVTSTIPTGQYTITTLISAVISKMNADSVIGATYSGVYNTLSNSVTITSDNTFTITPSGLNSRDISDCLGYFDTQTLASTQTGTSPRLDTNFIEIRVFVSSSENSYITKSDSSETRSISYKAFIIPVISVFNAVIYYTNPNPAIQLIKFSERVVNDFSIEVYNEYGELLDFLDSELTIVLNRL